MSAVSLELVTLSNPKAVGVIIAQVRGHLRGGSGALRLVLLLVLVFSAFSEINNNNNSRMQRIASLDVL